MLPTDAKQRKDQPIARGVLDYFPLAVAAVAELSRIATEQHHPGEPMHWDKSKSSDHADCIVRHLIERGTVDTDKVRHSTKTAWRALALLQTELEEAAKPAVAEERKAAMSPVLGMGYIPEHPWYSNLGHIPVAPHVRIDVELQDGQTYTGYKAYVWSWSVKGPHTPIKKWRLHIEDKKVVESRPVYLPLVPPQAPAPKLLISCDSGIMRARLMDFERLIREKGKTSYTNFQIKEICDLARLGLEALEGKHAV